MVQDLVQEIGTLKTLTASEARKKFFGLLKRSARGHQQFRIRHKEGEAILLAGEDYDALLETLELLSTPGLLRSVRQARREIARGETYPLEESRWQKKEHEAAQDMAAGRIKGPFKSGKALIRSLKQSAAQDSIGSRRRMIQ